MHQHEAELLQRDFASGLIYKRHDDALVQQQQSSTMSPELQRQWNEWCDSRIAYHLAEFNLSKRFQDFAGIMGRECGIVEQTIVKEMRAEFDARISELSAVVAALRVEVESLRNKKKRPNAT
jgi:hypothetical protein